MGAWTYYFVIVPNMERMLHISSINCQLSIENDKFNLFGIVRYNQKITSPFVGLFSIIRESDSHNFTA